MDQSGSMKLPVVFRTFTGSGSGAVGARECDGQVPRHPALSDGRS